MKHGVPIAGTGVRRRAPTHKEAMVRVGIWILKRPFNFNDFDSKHLLSGVDRSLFGREQSVAVFVSLGSSSTASKYRIEPRPPQETCFLSHEPSWQ